MGFFSKTTSILLERNRMAVAVGNVIELIDRYDLNGDSKNLLFAAWTCKVGIQDIMTGGSLNPLSSIYIVIKNKIQKMTVNEAYMRSVGRLIMISQELPERDKEDLLNIIEGGDVFEVVDRRISDENKTLLLNENL